MSTKGITTVKDDAKIPSIVSANLTDSDSWKLATTSGKGFGKNWEVVLRSYGFLAGVVLLSEYSQKQVVEESGANAGMITKAKAVLTAKANEIAEGATLTDGILRDALELAVADGLALCDAYDKARGKEKSEGKSMTEEQAVKNLFSAVDKYDLDMAKVLTLIADTIREREGE